MSSLAGDIEISVDELSKELGAGHSLQLIDVRESWEWEITRLPGSLHAPMGTLPRRVADFDRDRPTVTICHHGIRSLNSALFLRSQGFADVRSLAGGLDEWAKRIDPEMPRY